MNTYVLEESTQGACHRVRPALICSFVSVQDYTERERNWEEEEATV